MTALDPALKRLSQEAQALFGDGLHPDPDRQDKPVKQPKRDNQDKEHKP